MDQPGSQRRNIKNTWKKWIWKHNGPKSLGYSKSCSKRENDNSESLPQEVRKISNKMNREVLV